MGAKDTSMSTKCEYLILAIDSAIRKREKVSLTLLCKQHDIVPAIITMMKGRGILGNQAGKYKWLKQMNWNRESVAYWANIFCTDLRQYYVDNKKRADKRKKDAQYKQSLDKKYQQDIAKVTGGNAKTILPITSGVKPTTTEIVYGPGNSTREIGNLIPVRAGLAETENYYTAAVLFHLAKMRFDRNFVFKYNDNQYHDIEEIEFKNNAEHNQLIIVLYNQKTKRGTIQIPLQKTYIIDKQFDDDRVFVNADNELIHFKLS